MSDQPVGTMTRDGSEYSLLLEREYPLAIESVWSALVEPEKLARWLGNVRHDARVGGSFEIDFGKGDEAGGRILVYDPPDVWPSGGASAESRRSSASSSSPVGEARCSA